MRRSDREVTGRAEILQADVKKLHCKEHRK